MVIRYPNSFEDMSGQEGHGREAVASLVRNALSSAYDIDSSDISVSVIGSYVILAGIVNSPSERMRAEEIAFDLVGEDYVRSRLWHR